MGREEENKVVVQILHEGVESGEAGGGATQETRGGGVRVRGGGGDTSRQEGRL